MAAAGGSDGGGPGRVRLLLHRVGEVCRTALSAVARTLAYAVWVVAVSSPVAALTVAGWLGLDVAVHAGLPLLFGLLAVTMGGVALSGALQGWAGALPETDVLDRALAERPDAAGLLAQPRGFAFASVTDTSMPRPAFAEDAPQAPATQQTHQDAEGLDNTQRSMRGYPPCAAFAGLHGPRAPNPEGTWGYAPDGMSANVFHTHVHGLREDAWIGTWMDGLAILSYDTTSHRSPATWRGGHYFGFWPGTFAMLGFDAGIMPAHTRFGARINGQANHLHGALTRTPSSKNEQDFLRTLEGKHPYSLATSVATSRGAAFTPAWTQQLLARPLQFFFRRDHRINYKHTHTRRLDVTAAAAEAKAATARDEERAKRGWFSALGRATQTANHLVRGLRNEYAQPTLPADRSVAQLQPGDEVAQTHEELQGRMPMLNFLPGLFAGRYDFAQKNHTLTVEMLGKDAKDGARLRVALATRQQTGKRAMGVVRGALGLDSGQRSWTDTRHQITWPASMGAAAQTQLDAALTALSEAFRAAKDDAARTAAWESFVKFAAAMARDHDGSAAPKTLLANVTGEGASQDAGFAAFPACTGWLKDRLPTGFAAGQSFWSRAHSALVSIERDGERDAPRAVTASFVARPDHALRGPRGERTQLVCAELRHDADANVGARLQLQLRSQWSLTRANAVTVQKYALAPMRRCLGYAGVGGAGAGGVLQGAGWDNSPVKGWDTSRSTELSCSLSESDLRALANVTSGQWQRLSCAGADHPQAGVALSQALRRAFAANLPNQAPHIVCGAPEEGDKVAAGSPFAALQQAVKTFVTTTGLAAPGLLQQVLPDHARVVVRTDSNAYNEPQQALNDLRLRRRGGAKPEDLATEVAAAQHKAKAARLLALEDPFLDGGDRQAYAARLAQIDRELARLAA